MFASGLIMPCYVALIIVLSLFLRLQVCTQYAVSCEHLSRSARHQSTTIGR